MCMSCGCESPNDKHGDNRNITLDDLDQAAQAAGIGVGQAVQNMVNGWQHMSSSPEASGERDQQIPITQADQNQPTVYSQVQSQQSSYGQTQAESGAYAPSPGRDPGSTRQ